MGAKGKAVYGITVAAHMTGFHPQTIRQYERLGLIAPRRSEGGTRMFSDNDVERLRAIGNLTQTLGVNLAGVEIILRMREREGQLMNLAREMFGAMDESSRARFETLLSGQEPGLVPAGPTDMVKPE
jgi:MerR family transcriptional regulator, heat shock protein HspR